jgi:hypothetical protein
MADYLAFAGVLADLSSGAVSSEGQRHPCPRNLAPRNRQGLVLLFAGPSKRREIFLNRPLVTPTRSYHTFSYNLRYRARLNYERA